MLIGAHVSAAGGVSNVVNRTLEIEAECAQIFAASPRTWASKAIAEPDGAKFQTANGAAKLGIPLIHAKYLVALGSPLPENIVKSITALKTDMVSAASIGAVGVVFHPASHRAQGFEAVLDRFCDAVKTIINDSPPGPYLLLENSAGMGDHIGSKFKELAAIINQVDNPRLGVCFDTQHAWAAGYNIATPQGMRDTFAEFDDLIGLDKLHAVHLNDSKFPLGEPKDRHENIGHGHIGEDGFRNFFEHFPKPDMPTYLEVPGMEKGGPDLPNVQTAKRLLKEARG